MILTAQKVFRCQYVKMITPLWIKREMPVKIYPYIFEFFFRLKEPVLHSLLMTPRSKPNLFLVELMGDHYQMVNRSSLASMQPL